MAPAGGAAGKQEVEARQDGGTLAVVFDPLQELLDLADFLVDRELRREESRILQHTVGDPQFLGNEGVVIQVERLARARQFVEIAALLRLADPALGDCIQGGHGDVYNGASGRGGLYSAFSLLAGVREFTKGTTMGLRLKFNLVLLLVFAMGLGVTGYISHDLLHKNAREEVLRNAGVMMEAALSMRGYTVGQVGPLLPYSVDKFHPQSVPAYAATEIMNALRKK